MSGKKKKGFPFIIDSIKGKHSKLFSFYAGEEEVGGATSLQTVQT